jgi:DNA-3-methyladenine glycosylase I
MKCSWCLGDPLYEKYHDEEWGVPLHEDNKWFEFVVLDGMQAGLSWLTVLRKRENFRRAFDNFDPAKVATYDEAKILDLLQDVGIIRNKAKVRGAVTNAQAFLKIQKEHGSFDKFIWKFTGGKVVNHGLTEVAQYPALNDVSIKMSKELVDAGFKFVGPTICYAFMQAAGMVNDHVVSCFRHDQV